MVIYVLHAAHAFVLRGVRAREVCVRTAHIIAERRAHVVGFRRVGDRRRRRQQEEELHACYHGCHDGRAKPTTVTLPAWIVMELRVARPIFCDVPARSANCHVGACLSVRPIYV